MKTLTQLVCAAGMIAALLGSVSGVSAQVTVKVDSTRQWQGFNNVVRTNGYASYEFGSEWATADLRSTFITNSASAWPLNTAGVMKPNTNTYTPNDLFWNFPDGTPNKLIEANWYVDVFTNFAGQTVTFEGTVISNTIPLTDSAGLPAVVPDSRWHVVAFVKEFTSTYGFIGITSTTNLTAGPFSVSRAIGPNNVCQYGFYTFGPNTAPDSPEAFTGLGVLVEDSDPAIIDHPDAQTVTTGTTVVLSVSAAGATALTYQWNKDGMPLLDNGNIFGATSATLTIANAQVSDTGSYTVTVTDEAGSVDSRTAQVTVLDIVIQASPQNERAEQGSSVQFSVQATSASPITYQWKSVINGVTNDLANGPSIAGVDTPTLMLSNLQVAQSGFYLVSLTTPSGSADTGASLIVKSFADYPNVLENPGFERDPAGLDESPWVRFESSDPSFGILQDATDSYLFGGNVNVHSGQYVSFTSFNAEWSGIYQDVPASPGQIFAADMWFYNATGDPIPSGNANSESFLEVQFRAGAEVLQQYISEFITPSSPRDVWFNLAATNAGSFGNMPPSADAKYLVAPPGTTTVRFQVTMHDLGDSVAAGSLYYDSARLMLKVPASIEVSTAANSLQISWKSYGSTTYQVQYKENLSDPWTVLEEIAGTGQVISRSYPTTGSQRLYRVLTL